MRAANERSDAAENKRNDLEAQIAALQAQNNVLQAENDTFNTDERIVALQADIAALETDTELRTRVIEGANWGSDRAERLRKEALARLEAFESTGGAWGVRLNKVRSEQQQLAQQKISMEDQLARLKMENEQLQIQAGILRNSIKKFKTGQGNSFPFTIISQKEVG